ncbi:uncharacterized protein HMPREF1541_10766 [Cyphellophora europaea CBS 101466]|uniref:CipC-like antibiotic response protein n=1 Tax=Cyphellophora europaea (strain CBS 101466) TaxID=1220924 RepID=W2S6F8_CYPE1|nr:uncharacterized protein HMPREF1541_10766 [Cyphellophora europaea CBS 101466]ETN44215.1 hypothetical protein HMPREF1541_10766 [Cyphellophora europaea CBS 101466]
MFGFDDARDSHAQVYDDSVPEEHRAKFSHELISGAAAFEGMKLFEDHQRREGQAVSHGFAKELLAGFVGGEVDKLAETKGEDAWDRRETKKRAEQHAERMYDDHYGGQDQYDPNRRDAPDFGYDRRGGGEGRRGDRRDEYQQGGYQQGGYDQGGYQQGGYQQDSYQDDRQGGYDRRY